MVPKRFLTPMTVEIKI